MHFVHIFRSLPECSAPKATNLYQQLHIRESSLDRSDIPASLVSIAIDPFDCSAAGYTDDLGYAVAASSAENSQATDRRRAAGVRRIARAHRRRPNEFDRTGVPFDQCPQKCHRNNEKSRPKRAKISSNVDGEHFVDHAATADAQLVL